MAIAAFRMIPLSIGRVITSNLHTSSSMFGKDGREKRLGHIEQPDTVEGERGAFTIFSDSPSYELIDENLENRVINNVPFKKIPIVFLKCTRNNTKMTLADGNGTVITTKSCGTEGFKHCRKGTTVAAQAVANRILTIASDNEITMCRMVFEGLGPGRNAAYKVLEAANFNIVSFTDRTQAAEPWNKRPRKQKRI